MVCFRQRKIGYKYCVKQGRKLYIRPRGVYASNTFIQYQSLPQTLNVV
ncbi:hypothetical protein NEIMUCOT_05626 [Neisseria mucosa ATCC 25996]|uniref:Uncharacterized protein n=1 Tax=Neisseria mucosa (strain ATCC 25996 / DSM 4631 / NCTC 10774 / M26) TaxID=546266 RepID=D2ZYB8_NEIM2|nr:hypothetical protein NEIMUCOT_05626 [Neisseria mucosa ATCC 25996]